MGAFDWLTGSPSKLKQLPTMSGQQQGLQQNIIGGLQGGQSNVPGFNYLQNLFSDDPEAFSAYEKPYLRQFNEQIIPGIAERFTGMGSGSKYSSAMQNQLGQAASRLSESLAGQRAGLRSGAVSQLQGFLPSAFQSPFENVNMGGYGGLLQGAGQGFSQFGSQFGLLKLLGLI